MSLCMAVTVIVKWGEGIALTIKQLLPEAYVADCQTPKSDKSKLGTISIAEIKRGETYSLRLSMLIPNLIGQEGR
jgi:O-acetyl-ADP-ribose deacetylase (regulator of RNase III)